MIVRLDEYENRKLVFEELSVCDWRGGRSLAERLMKNTLHDKCGEHAVYVLLSEKEEIMAVCVLGEKDEIDTEMTPWLGYVYTFPAFRGQRAMGRLIAYVIGVLQEKGIPELYVSSNEKGLYEKYGFTYMKEMETAKGEMTSVYHRRIAE